MRATLPGQVVLVLQGGGALGAYQVGVLHALQKGVAGRSFKTIDTYSGISSGSICAALMAGKRVGIILSGGPSSVYDDDGPSADLALLDIAPVLGICYGMHLIAHLEGGNKPPAEWRVGTEHEKFPFTVKGHNPVPYEGPRGIQALLNGMQLLLGWEPIMEGEHIIGLTSVTGAAAITLEGRLSITTAAGSKPMKSTPVALAPAKAILSPMGSASSSARAGSSGRTRARPCCSSFVALRAVYVAEARSSTLAESRTGALRRRRPPEPRGPPPPRSRRNENPPPNSPLDPTSTGRTAPRSRAPSLWAGACGST